MAQGTLGKPASLSGEWTGGNWDTINNFADKCTDVFDFYSSGNAVAYMEHPLAQAGT